MTAVSSSEFFRQLKTLIALPDNVKSLELRLAIETEAVLTMTTGVTVHGPIDGSGIAAPEKTKRYHLVEISS